MSQFPLLHSDFDFSVIHIAGEPVAERFAKASRPLEPDAGNAAEGSEGPMPDRHFQPCVFPRMVFVLTADYTDEHR